MLPALLAALAWTPALLGLGSLVRNGADPALRPGIAGLLGLGAAGAIGTWLNFGIPLGPTVSASVWIGGSALFVLRRRWLLEGFRPVDSVPLAAVLAAATYLMRQPLFQYDTAFYHQQAIEWLTQGRIVPGIANVHFRLGFNVLWPTVAAVVDLPFTPGKSQFFLNLLPLLFGSQLAIFGLRAVVAGNRSLSTLMLAGTVLPVASATFGIGGLYVDYTAALVVYVALALWAAAIESGDRFESIATPAALLSVLAVLLKLSTAPLAAVGLALALARRPALPRRWWLGTGSVAAAAAVPWLGRGLLTSGCAAFPSWASCLEGLPWTVPEAKARFVAAVISDWARRPGPVPFKGWEWLDDWPPRILRDYPEALLLTSIAAAGIALWLAVVRRASPAALAVVATALAGTVFWFFTAPDPRFALGFLYSLALAPSAATFASSRLLESRSLRIAAAALLAALGAGLALRLDGHSRTGTLYGLPPWRPSLLSWPEEPRFAVRPVTTAGGVDAFVPVEGERCGREPICAPPEELDPTLSFDGYFHVSRRATEAAARQAGPRSP